MNGARSASPILLPKLPSGFALHFAIEVAVGEALVEVATEEGKDGSSLLVLAGVNQLMPNGIIFIGEVGGEVDTITQTQAREVDAGEATNV